MNNETQTDAIPQTEACSLTDAIPQTDAIAPTDAIPVELKIARDLMKIIKNWRRPVPGDA